MIAATGARQLHVAETEKYPHVTYFFNGGVEEPLAGEQRELVPSPRDVPTYDHKPEMSARAAADAFVRAWREDEPRFAIINFANADMVGHTGVIDAAVRAVEAVDACLGSVVRAVHESGGVLHRHRRHGNCEQMLEPDGSPHTAHTLLPVPLVVTSRAARCARARDPRRRRADGARAARHPAAAGDDGPLAVRCYGGPMTVGVPRARRSLRESELGAWRGLLRAHAALTKALDAELEQSHGVGLTSYEVLFAWTARPARGCGCASWPTRCC